MGLPVATGAILQCSFGAAPSTLNVLPQNKVLMENKPAANIMDNKPFLNIPPFGVCMTLSNPVTAAMTAAALGVLTPGPCTPVTVAPWAPGNPTTLVANFPILTDSSICTCAYGGVIKINVPGVLKESTG
jgi:Domain of unknown function (DUF4280)